MTESATPSSKVYNVDCMPYLSSLPDNAFDLAIVDPPYSDPNGEIGGGQRFGGRFDRYKKPDEAKKIVSRTGGTWAAKYGKKIIDWDVAPSQEYFTQLFRVSRNQIIWGGNYFNLPPTRCFVVWRKLTISENFSMAMAEYAWTSFHDNAKVFEFAPQGNREKRIHACQKPVELYAWLLKTYAHSGDKILDTHLGSGSSRIAAYKMGYDFVGLEIDKDYFDKAEERFLRECLGEYKDHNGKTIKQLDLFNT